MTTPAADDRDQVGPYRVIKPIGAGGSARIDLARIDRAYGFQRHVVLKRPLEHLRGDPGVAASLRREARIGGRLRHPNLVAILDAGIHDGYDYLALEYVHGAALRGVMQGDAPGQVRDLPLGVALAIVSEAARGMHEAHELTDDHGSPLGLVHRDVSPGNILVGLDGTVKLADFGIAVETRVSTLSGSMHGTVTYMAPEQCQGHAFDRRADVFSLGVILYELVTGTRLFWADNDVASLHRVLSGSVPRPRAVVPELPAALEDILLTAVAHDAEQRFATALALALAIEQYAASAGEVLSARAIASAVEAAIGPRPVPWTAAPAVVDPAPPADPGTSADGSLVELIAAIAPDEPVEPGFGDPAGTGEAGEAGEAAAATGAAASAAPGRRSAPLAAQPAPRPGSGPAPTNLGSGGDSAEPAAQLRPSARDARDAEPALSPDAASRRRRRAVIAGSAALCLIAAAVVAIAMTRGSAAPPALAGPAVDSRDETRLDARRAATAPASEAKPPGDRAATATPAADRAPGAATATARDARLPGDRAAMAPPAADRPSGIAGATAPGRAQVVRKRPPRPREPVAPQAAGPQAGTEPAPPPATNPPPPASPPARVEWKPTLLLPTDGSGAHR